MVSSVTGLGATPKQFVFNPFVGGIIDARATSSHFDAMLQPRLGPQQQSGLNEAKRQQQEKW